MNQFPTFTNRRSAALDIFNRFRHSGQLAALRSMLAGKPVHLEDYSDVACLCRESRRLLGFQDVPVRKITGSVGRSGDFTCDFRPLKKNLADRWIGQFLRVDTDTWPPIKVFKVGERYFVEDGHHRVSVARFLGMIDIQAEVWEYHVEPIRPAACEPACTPAPAGMGEPLPA
jgi:hypothetical protein